MRHIPPQLFIGHSTLIDQFLGSYQLAIFFREDNVPDSQTPFPSLS